MGQGRTIGNWLEVFYAFLKLGCTSFGGPTAHIGYFRRELVAKRSWLSERDYADLVGLCTFLPGPTSSQTGFAMGMMRAGPLGGLAAWTGFTIPSTILLVLFGIFEHDTSGHIWSSLIHGLKLVAVPIVAQAVIGMGRSLTTDIQRIAIALTVASMVLASNAYSVQILGIGIGTAAGLVFCRPRPTDFGVATGWLPSKRAGVFCLAVFAVLLILAMSASINGTGRPVALAAIFYRAGALVFGGGHVVLPLLRASLVPHWIDDRIFLSGYGATQAVPGPLFTFAAFLGARISGVFGACIALVFIFMPGLLLVSGMLPLQASVRENILVQRALAGVNAAVVGILAAALYNPLFTTGVQSLADIGIAIAGLGLLVRWRVPPLLVVALTVAASMAVTFSQTALAVGRINGVF